MSRILRVFFVCTRHILRKSQRSDSAGTSIPLLSANTTAVTAHRVHCIGGRVVACLRKAVSMRVHGRHQKPCWERCTAQSRVSRHSGHWHTTCMVIVDTLHLRLEAMNAWLFGPTPQSPRRRKWGSEAEHGLSCQRRNCLSASDDDHRDSVYDQIWFICFCVWSALEASCWSVASEYDL